MEELLQKKNHTLMSKILGPRKCWWWTTIDIVKYKGIILLFYVWHFCKTRCAFLNYFQNICYLKPKFPWLFFLEHSHGFACLKFFMIIQNTLLYCCTINIYNTTVIFMDFLFPWEMYWIMNPLWYVLVYWDLYCRRRIVFIHMIKNNFLSLLFLSRTT